MPGQDNDIWPPFVWTAVGLALTAGFGLGGMLFAAPVLGLPVGAWWPAAAQVHAQTRGRRSSGSSARRNAHIASVIASVRVTSGIWIRVNSQRPMDVASTSPENKPARAENAQAANAATSQQSRTAESAEGIRAAQSCTPKTRKQIAISQ